MPKRYLFVLGTFLLTVLLYVDRVCISAAKDPVMADLGLTKIQFGWVLAVFAIGYALFQTPGGYLSDRFGARRALAGVVTFWSLFTGLTATAWSWVSLLAARFFFGAGEAGAFPGVARATFSWIPMRERGVVQGINFSGSRVGAAVAFPMIALMIDSLGWRASFMVLMAVGFAWAVFWYYWFRDDPTEHASISDRELDMILAERQQAAAAADSSNEPKPLRLRDMASSTNMWLLAIQYFCSNFTFFFALTWMFPHIKGQFQLNSTAAGSWVALPFIGGAVGCWFAGMVIDRLYRANRWILSRRAPAIVGFILATVGMFGTTLFPESLPLTIGMLTLAIFGADMTLPPSWSACIDIGRKNSGVVSGSMNMAGNIGSAVTAIAYIYLEGWTGGTAPFFYLAASLNLLAVFVWLMVKPDRRIEEY